MTTAQHQNTKFAPLPDYWIAESQVRPKLAAMEEPSWLIGWRDACRSTDFRTVIASLCPAHAIGHKLPLLCTPLPTIKKVAIYATLCSFVLDYCSRQKVGGASVSYFLLKQFPVPSPALFAEPCPWSQGQSIEEWLLPRVLELTYTSWDLEPFARDCGYDGPPFGWDEERRFQLRCELDAAFFRLYLGSDEEWARDTPPALREKLPTRRHAIEHIMESFPIVKRKDEEAYGGYRSLSVVANNACHDSHN